MTFAKLIDGAPSFWRGHTVIDGRDYYTTDPRQLNDGWKEVDNTPPEQRAGFRPVPDGWTEDATKIYQVWRYEPFTPEPSTEEKFAAVNDRTDGIDAQSLFTAAMTDTLIEEDADDEEGGAIG